MEVKMDKVVRTYFEKHGFTVRAEVNHFDLVACKEDLVLVVEMKNTLSSRLIAQGIKAKKVTPFVYLVTPSVSKRVKKGQAYKDKLTILKALGLGLLSVDVLNDQVEAVFDPNDKTKSVAKKTRAKLLKEFTARKTAFNKAGSTRVKIVTAYKELALLVLLSLEEGPKNTQAIKQDTKHADKTLSILQKNYYGWFERIKRGVYTLTEEGKQALKDYQDVIKALKEENDESIK